MTTPSNDDWTEAEFLAHQRADAKEAPSDSVDAIKGDLAGAVDPRLWARRYPWATVGAAVAAGIAVAGVLVPRRGEGLRDKLARSVDALRGEPREANTQAAEKAIARAGLWPIVMSALFDLTKIGAQMAIRSQMARRRQRAEEGFAASDEPQAESTTPPLHPR